MGPFSVRERWLLRLLTGLSFSFLLWRAVTGRIFNFDGFSYLSAGFSLLVPEVGIYEINRPPLAVGMYLPAVALGRLFEPGSAALLVLPQLLAAAYTGLSGVALFALTRRLAGRDVAWLLVAAFMSIRHVIHFGTSPLTDVPAVGAVCFALLALDRLLARRGHGVLLCALAFALAVSVRFPLGLLVPTSYLALVGVNRLEGQRLLRGAGALSLAWALAFVLFVGLLSLVAARLEPQTLADLVEAIREFSERNRVKTGVRMNDTGLRDWLPVTVFVFGGAWMPLLAAGLFAAVRKPTRADVLFAATLLWLGVGTVVVVRPTLGRYLLPAAPAILWFTWRGAQYVGSLVAKRWPDHAARAGLLKQLVWLGPLLGGATQAVLDADAFHRAGQPLAVAQAVLELRDDADQLVLIGRTHNLYPSSRVSVHGEVFFNMFHFNQQGLEYLTRLPAMSPTRDGENVPVDGLLAFGVTDETVVVVMESIPYEEHRVRGPARPMLVIKPRHTWLPVSGQAFTADRGYEPITVWIDDPAAGRRTRVPHADSIKRGERLALPQTGDGARLVIVEGDVREIPAGS